MVFGNEYGDTLYQMGMALMRPPTLGSGKNIGEGVKCPVFRTRWKWSKVESVGSIGGCCSSLYSASYDSCITPMPLLSVRDKLRPRVCLERERLSLFRCLRDRAGLTRREVL